MIDDVFLPVETSEVVYTSIESSRPFLTTPFDDYTVSEGLLLLILIFAFLCVLWHFVKGIF